MHKVNVNEERVLLGDRIRLIMEALSLNQAGLAAKLGVSRSLVSEFIGGGREPSKEFMFAISELGVSLDWFLSGEGPMFRGGIKDADETDTPVAVRESLAEFQDAKGDALMSNSDGHGVPYYDVDVAAHWASEVPGAIEPKPEFYVDFQPFNDCTAFLPVYGDSMYPMIASGDVVAVKEIKNRSIILWGEAYLVVTNAESDSLRTVKLIHPHERPEMVNLRASNPNYKGDIPVARDSILGLYIVKGIVTRKQL